MFLILERISEKKKCPAIDDEKSKMDARFWIARPLLFGERNFKKNGKKLE